MKIKGEKYSGDIMVGGCSRLPGQEKDVDEAFFKKMTK